jgi:N-acetylglutamate synthase-like GNAT family acetyltransferase
MPDTLTIRPATRHDIAAVDALLARSYPALLKADYPPSILVTAVPIISRARPELLASGTYFVAETAMGEILGAGGWTPGRAGHGNVRHVVTDAAHLRRGIGRALFGTIFGTAREAGLHRLDCQATRTAVPFYRALGFAEIGPVEVPLAQGILFPAIRMTRPLGR